ncbi:MAG: radical SAM protein [Candidatus Riflebacteria bacterium]|nr:radical SAM protein [Candidatus Riflebacteria bacterium]
MVNSGLIRHFYYPVDTLGPKRRLGIWFQGCTHKCNDCISQPLWDFDESFRVSLAEVQAKIRFFSTFTDRLTISGGDPFEQPEFFKQVLISAREEGFIDILAYSGFYFQELQSKHQDCLQLLDVLIDGPFDSTKLSRSVWRGSENQEMYILSPNPEIRKLYEDFKTQNADNTKVQIAQSKNEFFVIGIPKDDKWKSLFPI